MKQGTIRKIQVLLVGAIVGFWLGPVFFNETGPGFELVHIVSALVGAFLAVVIYELAVRRLRNKRGET